MIGECSATAQGCTLFAEGRFEPSALCEGVEVGEGGIGSGGTVFQPFELICLESEERGGQSDVRGKRSVGALQRESAIWTTRRVALS